MQEDNRTFGKFEASAAGKKSNIQDMFKLGKMTLSSLFNKPETIQYPIQKKTFHDGLKGHIAIDIDTCIFCGLCQKACPSNSLEVSKPNKTWSINRFSCVQCNACIDPCPKKCLFSISEYSKPASAISVDCFTKVEEVI